jgi:cell division initiation protein
MIDLTPLEVRQKKGDFRRAVRGYDAELVNDFLDLVADRMEELVRQNMTMTDRVEALERELEEYQAKERALSDGLMAAQKLREETRSQAEKEGELMIREARMAAETARREASAALSREEEMLRQVRSRRAHLVESFRRLLERELAELAVIEETLELEAAREPGSRKQPAGPRGPSPASASPKREGAAEATPRGQKAGPPAGGGGSSSASKSAASKSPPEEAPDREVGDNDETEDWLKSLVEE